MTLLEQMKEASLNRVTVAYYWTETNGLLSGTVTNREDMAAANNLICFGKAKPIREFTTKNYNGDNIEIRVELTLELVDRPEPSMDDGGKFCAGTPEHSQSWNYTADDGYQSCSNEQ